MLMKGNVATSDAVTGERGKRLSEPSPISENWLEEE